MSSKAGFVLILVDHLDAEVNFYRRVLGVREMKTWTDAHLEKAAIFDMGALFAATLILAAAGMVSTELIRVVERRIAPWRYV